MTHLLLLLLFCIAPAGVQDPAVPDPSAIGPATGAPDRSIHRGIWEDGWSTPIMLASYPNWDYWWLNTRIGIDDDDKIHALQTMYNYSVTNYNFYHHVVDVKGNHLSSGSNWNGFQNIPITTDSLGHHHYIGNPVIGMLGHQDTGEVNDANYIYLSTADVYGDIYYSKLDPSGNYIYYNWPAAVGTAADAWTGENQLALNSLGHIYIVWSRSTHEIVYIKSMDDGMTWSGPTVLASDSTGQVTKVKMLIGGDDHMHLIWQHWNGSSCELTYMKLYPDGSTCVAESELTQNEQVWDPMMAMDSNKRIHAMWCTHYEGTQSLYHTVLDGTLDKGGGATTVNEISIKRKYEFYYNGYKKRYPKLAIDTFDNLHVIFDQGAYGNGTTKQIYYMKWSAPLAANRDTLSEATGGEVDFMLNAGAAQANRNYYMLGSASGTEPGLPLPGGMVTLPLNWDTLTDLILSMASSPALPGFHGVLDGDGCAEASLNSFGPLPPGLVGVQLNFAYLLYYPAVYYPYDYVSTAVSLEIVP